MNPAGRRVHKDAPPAFIASNTGMLKGEPAATSGSRSPREQPVTEPQPAPAQLPPGAISASQAVYLWLTALYITSLLLANIIGVKLFRFEPFGIPVEHTMGMLPFPITFLLTDLLNEYYGKRGARRVVIISLSMAALAWLLIWVSRKAPTLEGIPGTATHVAFENIFGAASLMYIASLIAFFCGSLLDIALFGLFKRLTRGRLVWFRATGSTIISQLFDSFVITFVFFLFIPLLQGTEPANVGWIFSTALTGYILKFVLAVLVTPFIYLGRWMIREWAGLTPLPASIA